MAIMADARTVSDDLDLASEPRGDRSRQPEPAGADRTTPREAPRGRPAGYIRISAADEEGLYNLQRAALAADGVPDDRLFIERTSSRLDEHPRLTSCLEALGPEDTLVVWRLDRLNHNATHLIKTLRGLACRGVHLRVLKSVCGRLDTVEPQGQAFRGLIATLDEFQRRLDKEKMALRNLSHSSRRKGRKPLLTGDQLMIAQLVMKDGDANVREFCRQIGITPTTLYRYIAPDGSFREKALRLVAKSSTVDEP